VHKPIGVKRVCKLLFAFENRLPHIKLGARENLNADQASLQIAFGSADGIIGRRIVNQIRFNSLLEQMFQTSGDEAFFVVGGKDGDTRIRFLRKLPGTKFG